MRLSSDRDSEYYQGNIFYDVFLDGVLKEYCTMADDELGECEISIFNKDEKRFITKTLYGKVEIKKKS